MPSLAFFGLPCWRQLCRFVTHSAISVTSLCLICRMGFWCEKHRRLVEAGRLPAGRAEITDLTEVNSRGGLASQHSALRPWRGVSPWPIKVSAVVVVPLPLLYGAAPTTTKTKPPTFQNGPPWIRYSFNSYSCPPAVHRCPF